MFRIFIDECGHADLKSSDHPNERYLSLTGIIMPLEYEQGKFTQDLDQLKVDIFGTRDIVLHRREILGGKPPFEILTNEEIRTAFDNRLLDLLHNGTYRVFTVVIDKKEHQQKYAVWKYDPYHYCLAVTLERYVMMLNRLQQKGDVMAESRGEKDNRRLQRAYANIYASGSFHLPAKDFQSRLSSSQIKIKLKSANIAGLQWADLIANPSYRALVCEKTAVKMKADFGLQIVESLQGKKYLRSPSGKITGWGTKWLP